MGETSTTPPLAALADRLGVAEDRLAALREYDEAEVAVLDRAVAEAIATEDAEFEAAAEKALGLVPRLLRGTVRAMMLPGGRRD